MRTISFTRFRLNMPVRQCWFALLLSVTSLYSSENTLTLKIFILAGQSNMQGSGTVEGPVGTMEAAVKSNPEKYGHLIDSEGKPTVRNDVWIVDISNDPRQGYLTTGYGVRAGHIGPEYAFGNALGDFYDDPVLIIKSAWGGKSLFNDFLPPGAKPYPKPKKSGDAGFYYQEILAHVSEITQNLQKYCPVYQGEAFEIAGFGWHQGWNDRVKSEAVDAYESNLVHFINDLRIDLEITNLPFVIANTGIGGWDIAERYRAKVEKHVTAQLAVGDWEKYPEFTANTAAVETRDFWRDPKSSPSPNGRQGFHWNRHWETFYEIGHAMGKAMIGLIEASPPKPEKSPAVTWIVPSKSDRSLLGHFRRLTAHVTGMKSLSNEEIAAHTDYINRHRADLTDDADYIAAAIEFIRQYDSEVGPLWVKHKGMNRKKPMPDEAIHWASFWIMQHIFDELYNSENLLKFQNLIDGLKFGSADNFPGKVEEPIRPSQTVTINGSYPKTWGMPIMHWERPARKPTGAYLVPGTLATVSVPRSFVGKGYQIRVGAHSWDFAKKPRVLRLDRVSAVYDINDTETIIGSPLGGGIYIEVPYEADAGITEITIRNASRAPFFSSKPFHKTSLEEWTQSERALKAPWADFQTEKFMMQVPTSFIYKLDRPDELMAAWDKAMDTANDLMGRPRLFGKESLYQQVDLQIRGSAYFPGYPSTNQGYNPSKDYGGYTHNHLIRGPSHAPSHLFHEQGHGFLFNKFKGDREAVVNLIHVAVMNQAFGKEINQAFRESRRGYGEFSNLNTTAVAWMLSNNFREQNPITSAEKSYQLKGHAKFVDIARLFGWEKLGDFFGSFHEEYESGNKWPRDIERHKYTHQMSKIIGVDVRPLMHFWGEIITEDENSDAFIRKHRLPASQQIYDLIAHYKTLIPNNNAEFREFTQSWWRKQPRLEGHQTEREHAAQWDLYDEISATILESRVDEILERFFPKGRPNKLEDVNL